MNPFNHIDDILVEFEREFLELNSKGQVVFTDGNNKTHITSNLLSLVEAVCKEFANDCVPGELASREKDDMLNNTYFYNKGYNRCRVNILSYINKTDKWN